VPANDLTTIYSELRNSRRLVERPLPQHILTPHALVEALATHPPGLPIVLWTTPSWTDRLNLWWVCFAIQRTRLPLGRFRLAQPEPNPSQDFPAGESLGRYPPPRLAQAMETLASVTPELLRTGAALWRHFAGPDPVAFLAQLQAAASSYPEWPVYAAQFGLAFPRLLGATSRRLRLAL
jgi:hypothetical protein